MKKFHIKKGDIVYVNVGEAKGGKGVFFLLIERRNVRSLKVLIS